MASDKIRRHITSLPLNALAGQSSLARFHKETSWSRPLLDVLNLI